LRHPFVLVLCLLVTVAAAAGVYLTAPKNYVASTQLILLGSNQGVADNGKIVPINPLVGAGNNAAQVAASALVVLSGSNRFQSALDAAHMRSSYSVAVSAAGGGVVMAVSTTNRVAVRAKNDLPVVVRQLDLALADQQRQAGAPTKSYFSLSPLTGNGDAQPASGNKVKLSAVVVGLGLILTIMAALIADARSGRRDGRPHPSRPGRPPRPTATA
jgi:hypothetical protein